MKADKKLDQKKPQGRSKRKIESKPKSKKPVRVQRFLNSDEWDEVRKHYIFGDQTVAEIAREFKVSRTTISSHAKKRGWLSQDTGRRLNKAKRSEAQGHANLISRLVQVFERQIIQTEEYLDAKGEGEPSVSVADRERDARTLASLTRTLKQLEELRRLPVLARKNQAQGEGQDTDGDDMRAQLQRRLDQLDETEDQSKIPPQSDDI